MNTSIEQKQSVKNPGAQTAGKATGVVLIVIGTLLLFTIIIPYLGIMMAIPGLLLIFAGFGLIAFRSKTGTAAK
ncbi:MAG TPA: hypothetical protein VH413_04935 [Verrucomicrobiae bacterium]|nr:hypothetical protein [Verrucomicrobiae bacterium]